eukprot:8534474-Pyramimonas_sp.AAC.1
MRPKKPQEKGIKGAAATSAGSGRPCTNLSVDTHTHHSTHGCRAWSPGRRTAPYRVQGHADMSSRASCRMAAPRAASLSAWA